MNKSIIESPKCNLRDNVCKVRNGSAYILINNNWELVGKLLSEKGYFKSIGYGKNHIVIIKKDGSVWSVGDNRYGQLGDGTFINSSIFVNTGIKAKSVACGDNHTVIIKKDDSVWSVGDNRYGGLGVDGVTNSPIFINSNIKAKSVACGSYYTTIIKKNNTTWSVGYNSHGELKDGTTTNRYTYVRSNMKAGI